MTIRSLAIASLLLVGCSALPAENGEKILSYDEAMDRTYTSERFGIELRHPSMKYDFECQKIMPVEVIETPYTIEFVPTDVYDGECNRITDPALKAERQEQLTSIIYIQKASSEAEVVQFVDRVFPGCRIDERLEKEDIDYIWPIAKVAPAEGPDFCVERITWNKNAGVIYFSYLGSKTGGAPRWPTPVPFRMSEERIEPWFDFAIMESIRYK